MAPEVLNKYNADNLAFAPTKDAPAMKDERLVGLEPYVKSGKFYQGAGTYVPNVIPIGNYLQAMVLNQDGASALHSLDQDWRRLAQRSV
jgi:raffinose/stachyose/melibiose transport system substrate-binding protein